MEREEPFLKPINISIDDMDKFEEKEMMKKRSLAKNIWYNWFDCLINYISGPIKMVGGVKDKLLLWLFKK